MTTKKKRIIIVSMIVLGLLFIIGYLVFRSYFPKVIYDVDKEKFLENQTAYEAIANLCYEHHCGRDSEMSVYTPHPEEGYISYCSRSGDESGTDKIKLDDELLQYTKDICKSYHLDGDSLLYIEVYNDCVCFSNMTRRAYLVYSVNGNKPNYVYFNHKKYDFMITTKITDNWYMVQISP